MFNDHDETEINDVVRPQTVETMTAVLERDLSDELRALVQAALAAGPQTKVWSDATYEIAMAGF